jgi:hypothetical protein
MTGNALGFSASSTSLERSVKEARPVSQITFSRPQVSQTDQQYKSPRNSHGQHLDPAATIHSGLSPFTKAQHWQASSATSNDLRAQRSQILIRMRHEEAGGSDTGDIDTHMVGVPLHMEDTSKSGVTLVRLAIRDWCSTTDSTVALPSREHGLHRTEKSIATKSVEQTCNVAQMEEHYLPSPPPSHVSIASEHLTSRLSDARTASSSFKRPFIPVSAETTSHTRQSITPEVCYARADTTKSQASNPTLPASPCKQRVASIGLRNSDVPARTGLIQSRKRKISIDLSSDEEDISDYAPSESESPSVDHTARPERNIPASKKTKTALRSSVATKTASLSGKATPGKNAFGFKTIVAPKLKPKLAASPSRVPGKYSASFTTPTRSSAKAKLSETPVSHPSKRRAALRAESRIHGLFDDELTFATECAIEAADQMEDVRLPETMNRMSITPALQGEGIVMLRDDVEDNGSEPDISEFVLIGGVIVRRGEVAELVLTEE